MTGEDLKALGLDEFEWFDNSRLSTLRGCERRRFYREIGPNSKIVTENDQSIAQLSPLGDYVGDGAKCGKVIHFANENFYRASGDLTRDQKIALAIRKAYAYWPHEFNPDKRDLLQNPIDKKHMIDNVIVLIYSYFKHWEQEEKNFETIASELGIAVLFKPEPGDPVGFKIPFWYFTKCDRFMHRKHDGNNGILESKTIGSGNFEGLKKRAQFLKFDTQTLGYTYNMRRAFPDHNISYFIPDIILVTHTGPEFHRDSFDVKEDQLAGWRFQTIERVERWRKDRNFILEHLNDPNLYNFSQLAQNTDDCSNYGQCAFFRLCLNGPMSTSLSDYGPDVWHPFSEMTKEEIMIVR